MDYHQVISIPRAIQYPYATEIDIGTTTTVSKWLWVSITGKLEILRRNSRHREMRWSESRIYTEHSREQEKNDPESCGLRCQLAGKFISGTKALPEIDANAGTRDKRSRDRSRLCGKSACQAAEPPALSLGDNFLGTLFTVFSVIALILVRRFLPTGYIYY